MPLLTIAKIVAKYLGYFCKETLFPRTFKIVQSGHTGLRQNERHAQGPKVGGEDDTLSVRGQQCDQKKIAKCL